MDQTILTQMVQQFTLKHGRLPREIVVHPVALAALALKESIAPRWMGITVRVAEVTPGPAIEGTSLGVYVSDGALRSFDL